MNKVINFHGVDDPAWFEKVVLLLKSKYNMISAQDIYEFYYNHKQLKNSCLITVDDGHVSSWSIIYPILKKHNVPAIFFVSPYISKNNDTAIYWFQAVRQINCPEVFEEIFGSPITVDEIWNRLDNAKREHNKDFVYRQNMTLEQIKQVDSEGLVAIGAHTMKHPFLARETAERSKKEITDSVSQLEALLGHPVLYFAYPNGRPEIDWGKREVEILKGTSVKISFSTKHENFKISNEPYEIPRFGLTLGSMTFVRIKLALGANYLKIRGLVNKIKGK